MIAAPVPPIFSRAPRIYPDIPRGEVEIPPPPPAPPAPTASMVVIVGPGIISVLSLGIMIFMLVQGNVMGLFLLAGVASGSVAALNFYSQKRTYTRKEDERQKRYRALLTSRREDLTRLRTQQHNTLHQMDPEPAECLSRAERLDRHLWERSPVDDDFLSVRVGMGKLPFSITVKSPKQEAALENDSLLSEAQELDREFDFVDDLPIELPLGEQGSAGIAGSRPDVLNLIRSIITQIATHHSPDEVKIAAVFPPDEAEEWSALRMLPHVWTDDGNHRYLTNERDTAYRMLTSFYDLFKKRLGQLPPPGSYNAGGPPPTPVFVIIIADPRLVQNHQILPLILGQGKAIGALPIFLGEHIAHLPKGCRAIVDLNTDKPDLITSQPTPTRTKFTPDDCPSEILERIGRAMYPIRLQRMATATEIPDTVGLLDMLGVGEIEELDVAERWRSHQAWRSLGAPIGVRAGGEPMILDMHERAHGPHGLAAGATGAGKSQMLQALIASLAANYHPHQVSFMVIDYNGGFMVRPFAGLPHLVGTITNLDGSMISRALVAIGIEIKRRQQVIGANIGKDIDDAYNEYLRRYAIGQVKEPMPHLILIVDECAELVSQQQNATADRPNLLNELVSAARVGRKWGIHLLLATQKPGGVINDQIWANSRFRICLRVENPQDSQEMLKRPEAAGLSQKGRAYLQVGLNEIFEQFQVAYGGAPYEPSASATAGHDEIVEIALDGSRRPLRLSPRPIVVHMENTQLEALVNRIRAVTEQEEIAPLPALWLPALPENLPLDSLLPQEEGWNGDTWEPASTWIQPPVGLLDDPVRRFQGPLALNLGREGNLVVYGAPGTGKTTFLRTLVTSLVRTHSPNDVNFYMLDFGSKMLSVFAGLPHVGGVVTGEEEERISRLLRYITNEMAQRKDSFARSGVSNLADYRKATGQMVPAIVIVLDNYNGFVNTFDDKESLLAEIAREGGSLGIHVVMTASSYKVIKSRTQESFNLAVSLQLADNADYSIVVGRRIGDPLPAAVKGRGLARGNPPLEFQTAMAPDTATLKTMVDTMAKAWKGRWARPIPVMPKEIPLCNILPPDDSWPLITDRRLTVPLGIDVDVLDTLSVDLNEGPHFIITGPPDSGKTTLLQSWLLALAERYRPDRLHLYLVDMRRSGLAPLQRLPHTQAYIDDDDKLSEALSEIRDKLRTRRQEMEAARQEAEGILDQAAFIARYPALVVAIDDYDIFRDTAQAGTRERLEQLIRKERDLGLHVLLAGLSGDISGSSFEGLIKALKDLQTGFVLGSNEQYDLQVLNISRPLGEAGKPLPEGEGYYGRRGKVRKIKAATPMAGMVQMPDWVALLRSRRA